MADSSYYLRNPNGDLVAIKLIDNGDGTYSMQVSGGGGGTQYTEDAAAAANPVGSVPILVRKDTPSSEVSADGDNIAQRGSAYGAAYVTLLDAGGAAAGAGTQYTEDAAAAANPVGNALVLVREDARAGSLVSADGDNVAARGNNKGEQYVLDTDAVAQLTAIAGYLDTEVAAVVAAVQIIDDWDETDRAKVNLIAGQAGITAGAGAVAASTPRVTLASDDPAVVDLAAIEALLTAHSGYLDGIEGKQDSQITALQLIDNLVLAEDAASANADPGVQVLAVRDDTLNVRSGTEGDYEPLHTDANGALWTHPTDSVAHDAADAGNGLKIAAKAKTALSGITLVADGDRTDLHAGVDGVLIVRPDCNLEDVVQERTTNTDGASTAFASGLAAPGAGIRLWIKTVTICNSSATFCTVDLRDGAAGSVLWTFPVPATSGVTHVFDLPLKLTANTALAFDASAATTTLTISVNGFKSKV